MIVDMQNSAQQIKAVQKSVRDVTSTAKLFNFTRPVYLSDGVWRDCVEMTDRNNKQVDELAVLQRLRHVLFMASSALHGRIKDLECEFRIHRIPNDRHVRYPEPTMLKLMAYHDENNQPVITIKRPNE